MATRRLGLAAAVAVLALAAPEHAPRPHGLRIMPLGDSITYGQRAQTDCRAPEGGYRTALWRRLADAGVEADFVGSQRHGPPSLPDKDHEGHCGRRIDEIAGEVEHWLTSAQPDVVLVHLGTNDLYQDHDAARAPARLGALVASMRAARPGLRILVATLVPSRDPAVEARVRAFNRALPAIVARAGSGVALVDQHRAVRPSQIGDLLHPTRAGYEAMARAWAAAVTAGRRS